MAELKPYQILIEDQQFDANDPLKAIGSRVQYTTSYGENEQNAMDNYQKNFPSTPNRLRTEVVGIDPSFEEMMRTNTSSPNTPYFSQDTSRYYGMQNPYAVASLPNTQNIDVNRARQAVSPFTQELGMQPNFYSIMQGINRMAPAPTPNLNQMESTQLPTTYDAQTTPTMPFPGTDQTVPFESGVSRGGGGGYSVPGMFGGFGMNFPGQDPFAAAYTQSPGGQLTSTQIESGQTSGINIRQDLGLRPDFQLREFMPEPSTFEMAMMGQGATVFLNEMRRNNAILNAGVTPAEFNSFDPNVLNNVMTKLTNAGIFGQSEFASSPSIFGESNVDRALREADTRERTFTDAPTTQPDQEEDTDELTMGTQITPEDFNAAMQAIREVQGGGTASLPDSIIRLGMSDTSGNSPAAQLVRQFGDAQARSMPFEQATQQRQETLEQARLDLDVATVNNALDIAGMQNRSDNYRTQIGFASDQMQMASTERINNAQMRSTEMISQASNQSNERIAEVSANASRDVAQINGLSQQQVALINTRSAKEVAEITGLNQREVERIKGDIQTRIAQETNLSKEDIARMQTNAQVTVASVQTQSAGSIATKNNLSAQLIAEGSNSTQLQVAEAQRDAQAKVAKENRLSQENVAKLIYSDDAAALRLEEFNDLKQIEQIRQDYAKELARLTDTEAIQIAGINAQVQEDLQGAQLAFDKERYEAELEALPAQLEFQREMAEMQYQGGYETPEEFKAAQIEIGRGGLSQAEDRSLQVLLAGGGLTPDQRLAEIQAESRSQEMNSLMALLSNPQALGAFVTIISGELPFDSVPTMGQLAEMTPSRIEYLQGALSALGIDPQTFIRMAQDVTPQAFQETGPFGQLSAMIS
tara:strand:- start:6296 stop:8908 length:2613 start_codon:yes stop_codon:yes gene_type:complete